MDQMDELEKEEGGQRKHVRADDRIPVYYEHVDEAAGQGEEETTPWEVMFDDIAPGTEENPRLYELLFDINQKLNILVNHLTKQSGFNLPEAKDVNISGGGLRFSCRKDFRVGERLVVKTFLPVYSHVIRLNCEVVRTTPLDDGGFEVAVKFIDLDEATRDKIIRYIFAKQRRDLRTKKDTPGSAH